MPRIRQNAQRYADEDFWREIQSRKALAGIKTDKDLAESIGISPSGLSKRKQNVGGMTITDLQRFVKALKPSPVVVLKMLGYSAKDIPRGLQEDRSI